MHNNDFETKRLEGNYGLLDVFNVLGVHFGRNAHKYVADEEENRIKTANERTE